EVRVAPAALLGFAEPTRILDHTIECDQRRHTELPHSDLPEIPTAREPSARRAAMACSRWLQALRRSQWRYFCCDAMYACGPNSTALRIHPHHFPMMTIEVVEAPAIHETVVLRGFCVPTAGVDRLLHESVDFSPAFAGQGNQRLGLPRRVAHLARGERFEECL